MAGHAVTAKPSPSVGVDRRGHLVTEGAHRPGEDVPVPLGDHDARMPLGGLAHEPPDRALPPVRLVDARSLGSVQVVSAGRQCR